MSLTRNPNEAKYFDEEKGCTLNTKCVKCKTPIYVPEEMGTNYEGKLHTHNSQKGVIMSVCTFEGCVCLTCWEPKDGKSKTGLRPYKVKSDSKRKAV